MDGTGRVGSSVQSRRTIWKDWREETRSTVDEETCPSGHRDGGGLDWLVSSQTHYNEVGRSPTSLVFREEGDICPTICGKNPSK